MMFEYTIKNRFLAWLDWKEEWRVYICWNSDEKWLVPERFWEMAERDGCPHCGREMVREGNLPSPEDYAAI
jgi:hypothetical protein